MKPTKILVAFLATFSLCVGAQDLTALDSLENSLISIETPSRSQKTLGEIKEALDQRNMDIEVAYENFIIAKKEVTVARAAFNPIRTGHVLGIALGLEYLWLPLIVDSIISIPTKIYNVSKNKYLAKASGHNYEAVKERLFNEMAKLYYDILTHKMILDSIDTESKILNQYATRLESTNAAERVRSENRMKLLKLGIERTDIYKLYVSELAAFRTMLSYDITSLKNVELAPINYSLDARTTDAVHLERLESLALVGSDAHKVAINMHRAALQNVKAVKWSILSFSGLNFSYGRRVRVAKNEAEVARLELESSEVRIRNNARDTLHQLESAIRVSENFAAVYSDSLSLYFDILANWQEGSMTDETVVRAALDLVRDYRNEMVSRYRTFATLDDFSYATSINLNPVAAKGISIQDQIRKDRFYGLIENDYRVKVEINNYSDYDSLELSLVEREELDLVESVLYTFDTKHLRKKDSDKREKNFRVRKTLRNLDYRGVKGEALVLLKNGHQFIVDFKL